MRKIIVAGALAFMSLWPLAASAQGVPGGVAYGASEGNRRAGPVGGLVGGVVGGVIGGVDGVLGIRPQPLEETAPPAPTPVVYTRPVHHWRRPPRIVHRHRVLPHRRHVRSVRRHVH